mmetsp:Transcript_38188/g.96679  ORF Transcript_38188/g.96679 Transcript_38188/m.96679 type:complete len:214 (-) Transcript_38188:356-997(-)
MLVLEQVGVGAVLRLAARGVVLDARPRRLRRALRRAGRGHAGGHHARHDVVVVQPRVVVKHGVQVLEQRARHAGGRVSHPQRQRLTRRVAGRPRAARGEGDARGVWRPGRVVEPRPRWVARDVHALVGGCGHHLVRAHHRDARVVAHLGARKHLRVHAQARQLELGARHLVDGRQRGRAEQLQEARAVGRVGQPGLRLRVNNVQDLLGRQPVA